MVETKDFKIIKNKLNLSGIKTFSTIELKVNDMHIIGFKSPITHYWNVTVLHEEKDTHKNQIYKTNRDFMNYLNAYIKTARTPIEIYRKKSKKQVIFND